jgi:hypothetical protein
LKAADLMAGPKVLLLVEPLKLVALSVVPRQAPKVVAAAGFLALHRKSRTGCVHRRPHRNGYKRLVLFLKRPSPSRRAGRMAAPWVGP